MKFRFALILFVLLSIFNYIKLTHQESNACLFIGCDCQLDENNSGGIITCEGDGLTDFPKRQDVFALNNIKYEKFEPYMLQVLMINEYEPNPAEHLLAAFRVLDPKGEGTIRKDVMKELLVTKGIPLRPREYESFETFAIDPTGQLIYYEDYVTKLVEENERHKEYLCKDYENFKPSGTK